MEGGRSPQAAVDSSESQMLLLMIPASGDAWFGGCTVFADGDVFIVESDEPCFRTAADVVVAATADACRALAEACRALHAACFGSEVRWLVKGCAFD